MHGADLGARCRVGAEGEGRGSAEGSPRDSWAIPACAPSYATSVPPHDEVKMTVKVIMAAITHNRTFITVIARPEKPVSCPSGEITEQRCGLCAVRC